MGFSSGFGVGQVGEEVKADTGSPIWLIAWLRAKEEIILGHSPVSELSNWLHDIVQRVYNIYTCRETNRYFPVVLFIIEKYFFLRESRTNEFVIWNLLVRNFKEI